MSHKKGPGFERKFCKDLSRWWTAGRRDDIFWRTASSGARATIRSKKGLRTADSYGDVKADHIIGKPLTKNYVFSLKRGYTGKKGKKSLKWVSILDIIDSPKNHKTKPAILIWWEEIEKTRVQAKRKFSFIIFKRDRKNEVIAMSAKTFDHIYAKNRRKFVYSFSILTTENNVDLIFIPLHDFFKWCKPIALGYSGIKRRSINEKNQAKKKKKVKRRKIRTYNKYDVRKLSQKVKRKL